MQLAFPFTRPAPAMPRAESSAPQPVATPPLLTSDTPLPGSPGKTAPDPLRDLIEFVRHPRARRYVIRVRADGTVRVTIPRGGSKRDAVDFAARQRRWIEEERGRVAGEAARRGDPTPPEVVRDLRARAARELPPRLLELAAEHGLRVSRISVRNQRWRWGSCSRSGHICLNWRLVDMPPEIRDYVMIHELMHLRRMDHSPMFWKLVAAACPGHQTARHWLRDFGRMRES
jgi:predicted metal-dependent hydrolase